MSYEIGEEKRRVRVISGRAKGKRLKAPAGHQTRPITDMIKEALFNVLGTRVPGCDFLDLFAGSGAVGIEALSREARRVVFIDNNGPAIRTIKENIRSCGFTSGFEIYRNDVLRAMSLLAQKNQQFDLIYIDPPFTREEIFVPVMDNLGCNTIVDRQGLVIIRTPRKMRLPATFGSLKAYRMDTYGESTLCYYHKEVAEDDGDFQDFGRA